MSKEYREIALASPDIGKLEEDNVLKAIRSTWISSTGEFIKCFEKEFSEMVGTTDTVAVCNGTVALHLALLALDVRPGDEVIVPSLTFIATANAVRYVGAEPVFVDVDPETWCIDPEMIEPRITSRTKGIIAVDLYGHPADMDAINRIAAVNGLWVVEDAAEAHTALYKGYSTGGLAKIGTFSFYGNKIFTCGEGGALTLNDPALTQRIRTLRGQGMDLERRYYFPVTGYNYRITNVACAILCAQLARKEEILARRHNIFAQYRRGLDGTSGIGFQPVASWAVPAPWLFCITIDTSKFGHSRDELMSHLKECGIDTRPFFIPLHSLPPFHRESVARGEVLPITEILASTGINLPTHAGLTTGDIQYVCAKIREFAG